jgi:4'-phosphopantetheinyl transferase
MNGLFFPEHHSGADNLKLLPGEIHMWLIPEVQNENMMKVLSHKLNDAEKEKASRYYFEKKRRQYIITRGVLKILLEVYTRRNSEQFQIVQGIYGKPFMRSEEEEIHFNISHSEGLSILGFSKEAPLGVDIEIIREIPERDEIAEKYFSKKENNIYKTIPEEYRTKAFFNCWTRKEAFIKAIGEGFSKPLDQFDVTFLSNEKTKLISIDGDTRKADEWSLQELKTAQGYVSAFAVKKRKFRLSCWTWNESLLKMKNKIYY